MTNGEDGEKRSYFDVEKFRRVQRETSRSMGRRGKLLRHVTGPIDSMQGFLVPFLFYGLAFGVLLAIVIGARYGVFAVLGFLGLLIGGVGYVAEKKHGDSIQIGEYDLWKRILSTGIAFLASVSLIFLILYLSGLLSLLVH